MRITLQVEDVSNKGFESSNWIAKEWCKDSDTSIEYKEKCIKQYYIKRMKPRLRMQKKLYFEYFVLIIDRVIFTFKQLCNHG